MACLCQNENVRSSQGIHSCAVCIRWAGLPAINYFETAFPEVVKFGTNNGHPEMLHNKAEWIVDLTTKVSSSRPSPP